MDHGLQASYTAGMYFIFQKGVVHDFVITTDDILFEFEGNTQQIDLTVVIPMKSLIITCIGIGIIFLGGIFAVFFSRCGKQSLIGKIPEADVTPDVITDMMVNATKYPQLLLDRRFETNGLNSKFKKVRIDGLVLGDGDNGSNVTLTRNGKQQTSRTSSASTEDSASSSKASETNVMLDSQNSSGCNELQNALTHCPPILANEKRDATTTQNEPESSFLHINSADSKELISISAGMTGTHDEIDIEAGELHNIHIDTDSDIATVDATMVYSVAPSHTSKRNSVPTSDSAKDN